MAITKKRCRILNIFLVICMLTSMCTIVASAVSTYGSAGVPRVQQAKSNWCWAASGEAILRTCGKSVTQYAFAAKVLNNVISTPNVAASADQVLSGLNSYGLNGTLKRTTIGYSTACAEINSKKPIFMGTLVSGQNVGHAVVIDGYDSTEPTQKFIVFMDPIDGKYYTQLYNDLITGNGTCPYKWVETIHNIRAS